MIKNLMSVDVNSNSVPVSESVNENEPVDVPSLDEFFFFNFF